MRTGVLIGAVAACLTGGAAMSQMADVPYSVASEPWELGLGNHRARVQVDAAAEAVRVTVPWRRRDRDPEAKRIIVVDAATGKQIPNVLPVNLTREVGEIVFQPTSGASEYYVYYLPFQTQDNYGWYGGNYLPPAQAAEPEWLKRIGLDAAHPAEGPWRDLPEAKVVEFQARTAFSRFDPMEVAATQAEVEALRAAHPDAAYLVLPEDRRHAIWMPDDLPLRWVRNGPSREFADTADRDEFLAFQLGVWADRQALSNVRVEFGDLAADGGASIPASALRCINEGGTDWTGDPLVRTVDVAEGRVQALWCGVLVPRDAAPGVYRGTARVVPSNAPPTEARLAITVTPNVAVDHGDNDLWRFARLRWLDSTIAQDDEVTAPYTPLELEGRTVRCLGRSLTFGADGLPASIESAGHQVLEGPIAFRVVGQDGPLPSSVRETSVTKRTPGAISWHSAGRVGSMDTETKATMEFDGHLMYSVTLRPTEDTPVEDVALEVPFARSAATYLMGIGRKGGIRPKEWSWKWGGQVYYDSFWMGDVPAGMQVELRGASYSGPMVNLYWGLGQLKPPPAWDNAGQGGVAVSEVGDTGVVARVFSGKRTLRAGEEISFEFALLITPVKPLDTAANFRTRYFHDYQPVEKVAATGANVINIHHANELNPYINYPFLATEKLRAYVDQAHARGMKVKIYYTLRELTNHVAEMPALRSLGHEVFAPGGGGGYPWLREHLGGDYAPQWYQPQPDGEACAATANAGASRWYNYYLEGLAWLVRNVGIDGLYLDDVSYDRRILKRVRKILDRNRAGCMIDLHSNTAFSHGPANQYMEFFPYVDRLWFGEGFNYDDPPDYWLTEICGIPYGLMGEMLQNGGNPWRGMLYGMTSRMPWAGNPGALWRLWDEFGIAEARMVGYWDPACPVRTDNPDVLATAYVREGRTLVSVATWAKDAVNVHLSVDWTALGLSAERATVRAPAVEGFQEAKLFAPTDAIPIAPGHGWLLWVEHAAR